jgi:hypothetical protein
LSRASPYAHPRARPFSRPNPPGYWPLYRYAPPASKEHAAGEPLPRGVLTLDSKKLKGDLEAFLSRENR